MFRVDLPESVEWSGAEVAWQAQAAYPEIPDLPEPFAAAMRAVTDDVRRQSADIASLPRKCCRGSDHPRLCSGSPATASGVFADPVSGVPRSRWQSLAGRIARAGTLVQTGVVQKSREVMARRFGTAPPAGRESRLRRSPSRAARTPDRRRRVAAGRCSRCDCRPAPAKRPDREPAARCRPWI
jgi:hypothetical protein